MQQPEYEKGKIIRDIILLENIMVPRPVEVLAEGECNLNGSKEKS